MDGLTPAALVAEARQAGLRVWRDGSLLCLGGPRHLAGLAHRVMAHKAAVLAVLEATDGPGGCARCGMAAERLVVTYWSEEVAFCPACCPTVAELLDAEEDAWPPVRSPD